MFFGILCMAAVVYGTASIFNGVVTAILPKTLKSATDYVVNSMDKTKQELNLKKEEGLFDDTNKIVLAELFPPLTEADLPAELKEILFKAYWLTDSELDELNLLIAPLNVFDIYFNFNLKNMPPHLVKIYTQHHWPIFQSIIIFFKKIPVEERAKG